MRKRASIFALATLAIALSACEKKEEATTIVEPAAPPAASVPPAPTAPVTAPTSISTVPQADQNFAMKAASGGLAEVEASRAISEKTTDANVREFAQKMVQDHAAANDELMAIAMAKKIQLSAGPVEPHVDVLTKLRGAMGADSDRTYVQDFGLQAHKEAVALFDKQASEGTDPELKAFAEAKLPTLKAHLEHAQKLSDSMPK